jgi:hypothetical protein
LVIENILLAIDRFLPWPWRSAAFLGRHAEFSYMTNDKFSMINFQSLNLPKTVQGRENEMHPVGGLMTKKPWLTPHLMFYSARCPTHLLHRF